MTFSNCFVQNENSPSQEIDRIPPSPSASAVGSRRTSVSRHSQAPSAYSIEVEATAQRDGDVSSPPKGRRRQLLLLTRSTGTQTDPIVILPMSPHPQSLLEEHSPSAPHSEASSFQEGRISQFSILLDKVNSLLHKIVQADVRTLTNRLKRQHLAGADVGHLSRTTISGILNEVSGLRSHFRAILEDERSTTLISRKEFRALLKTYSELFQEIGSLRATVNEVVLNPQVATKLREEAMDLEDGKGRTAPGPTGALGSWIAPLSKLWATPKETPDIKGNSTGVNSGLMRASSTRNRLQPPRIAPKLAPAVSASTTTVNVEFTNSGIRRAISTTPTPPLVPPIRERGPPSPLSQTRPQLRGIFAGSSGAPVKQSLTDRHRNPVTTKAAEDIPQLEQGTLRGTRSSAGGPQRLHRETNEEPSRRLSRVVDAMVDQHAVDDEEGEDGDFPSNLLQRTLRPRGLSDSSIHSTFIAHGPPLNRILTPSGLALSSPALEDGGRGISSSNAGRTTTWLDRDSVLQSIGRKMQSFRFATASEQIRTRELPEENAHSPSVEAATSSSTPGGTPTAITTTLPPSSSPPSKAILVPPLRLTSRRVEGSLSPTRRTPRAEETQTGSPNSASAMPSLTAWANPRLQRVLENRDGGYNKLSTDSTIGRTYGRSRGL